MTETVQPPQTKIETRGHPKLPETVIKELNQKITELQQAIESSQDPYKEMAKMAEIIRIIQRAMKGLSPDDDVFQGLINAKDIRERTRLDETALLSHAAMRTAASNFPMMEMFGEIADMEDPYYISQDGLGRSEAIVLQQAKTNMPGNMILNMPNLQGEVAADQQQQQGPQHPQKKGGIRGAIDRVLHR
jgi:hypothetical protein